VFIRLTRGLGAAVLLALVLMPTLGSAGQVNAFIYHRFDDQRYPSTNIAADIFARQLEYLRDQQIPVVSTRDISGRIARGEELPAHAVMLTVDDSYRSFYEVGMPLIRRYAVPVSLFVNTDAVGTPGYMTWDEIRAVVQDGVEIGNHTANHAYLVEMEAGETLAAWRQRVRADIEKAQDVFAKELGFRPEIFAYPYGEYAPEVIEILRDLGFIVAYAQQSGVIDGHQDPLILPRFPMGGPFATLEDFIAKARMRPLPVREQEPLDPLVRPDDNPPLLDLHLPDMAGQAAAFNCFVQGDNRCTVEENLQRGAGWYRVVAEKPLTGRRNKYTLTYQSADGWLWFSQLWINAERPLPAHR
jgi:peptidoglycan/xylan/chitin deacetylase (PgdA/CDA1 family)